MDENMSSFTDEPEFRFVDDEGITVELLKGFDYYVGAHADAPRLVIKVPKGFKTDFASVPLVAQAVVPRLGRHAKAAIVHDYCYVNAVQDPDYHPAQGTVRDWRRDKAFADYVFLDAMEVLNVPVWRRYLVYWAVRIGGRGNYGKKIQAAKGEKND